MSGVASIGSLVKLHAPNATRASVSASMSHRCPMANRIILSSMSVPLVVVRSAGFFNVRLHQIALLDHNLVACFQARKDLDLRGIALAQFDWADLVRVAHADENDLPIAEVLHGRQRHAQRRLLLF